MLLSLAIAETTLRLLRPQAVGLTGLPLVYQPDPVLGYRYRPGATGRMQRLFEIDRIVTINSLGYHDVEREQGFDGPLVVALGDSFTAALHVPPESSWTHLLESELRTRVHPELELWNLGLDGTGTDVHLELLREQLRRRVPDAVVLAFFANDVADVARGPIRREERHGYVLHPADEEQARAMVLLADQWAERRLARWSFDRFFLVRLAWFLAAGDRNLLRSNVIGPGHLGEAPAALDPRAAARLRVVLGELAALARTHGFPAWVVALPGRDIPEASARVLRATLPGRELGLVDPAPALRRALAQSGEEWRDLYWRWDGHLNAHGHDRLAHVLAAPLASRLAHFVE